MDSKITSAMEAAGILISEPLIFDGDIHRLPVSNNGRKKNAWYVGSGPFVTFGRWDTGLKTKVKPDKSIIITPDMREQARIVSAAVRMEKRQQSDRAAEEAKRLMDSGSSDISAHPYIIAKGISGVPVGFVVGEILCVPMTKGGELRNVQRIWPDGTKKFLFGGDVQDCAAVIPGDDVLCICEGYATGASIYLATGHTVVLAFSAGQLVNTAKLARKKHPDARIIICADNDQPNQQVPEYGGTGIKEGKRASKECNGELRYPPKQGHDFNDLSHEDIRDIIDMRESVLTCDDIAPIDNLTLCIPDNLLRTGGLIADGLAACRAANMPDIIQYNFPVVLSLISRAIAGKIQFQGRWPSFYNIKIGGTSTGKTDSDKIMKKAIVSAGLQNFYGPTDFSSGPGLLRGMAEEGFAQCIVTLDEITYLFRRGESPDPISNGKMDVLLQLYSNAGGQVKKPYGDKAKSITIDYPCLVLVGNATPGIFDDIRAEDLTSGAMQRFDFWYYGGQIPYRQPIQVGSQYAVDDFVDKLGRLFHQSTYQPTNKHDLRGRIPGADGAINIGITDQAQRLLNEYSIAVTDAANQYHPEGDEGRIGIQSRKFDCAIKYALVHIGATREPDLIFDPMTEADLRWGIDMAEMLATWKSEKLVGKINEGRFHADCELFKAAILAATKARLQPTGKVLANRRPRLKTLKPQEFRDIIQALKARGEIIVDESREHTRYFLPKE